VEDEILSLAESVIRNSSRQNPADTVLREALRDRRAFPKHAKEEVSRLVFGYYRWFGWLDPGRPLREEITRALDLAERFSARPETFADDDLMERAAPAWVRSEIEVTPAWVRSLQTEPRLWLRARKGQGASLAGRLRSSHVFGKNSLSDIVEYQGYEDLFRTPEFHAGEFELQDLSSQAVGLLCAPQPGETWWDACAGEGGKTLHLSDLMVNQGLIWASDRAAWRLQRLKRRAARAKVFNYRTALWNGGSKLPTKTKFDGVLVDAPCSGTGTWQRNPHARWTTAPQDISELRDLQIQLLTNASAGLKPGGKLVYAVCTLTRSETTEVVRSFERLPPEFSRVNLRDPLNPNSDLVPELWLWPQDSGGNGMFVVAWERSKAA